ncbi:MAG TPA: hypothetical protein ENH82_15260 [bacterium]|nr:hypothetical protein [bacterium]
MEKRELDMYSLEEAVSAILDGTPAKQIARLQKISKNTVKKYRSILESILDEQPSFQRDLSTIMGAFRSIRRQQRYSDNHGWLEINTALVEKLTTKCDNYVRLLQVLQEHGFRGSYSSLQRYVSKSAIIKASFLNPVANKSYADVAKHYGFQIDPCLPGTPEHKGKVESGVKYVKNNFLLLGSFANFTDANRKLQEWNDDIARMRIHGTTRRKPEELFEKYEKEVLGELVLDRLLHNAHKIIIDGKSYRTRL